MEHNPTQERPERAIFIRSGLALYISLLVVGIIWLASASDRLSDGFSFKGKKGGVEYYNLLVHGFLAGHTYMDVEVNPALLSSDPEVRAKAPTLLDANFYKGHFYLYYGVTPAVLLFLPYSALTGQDLSSNVATAFFVVIGFLLSIRVLYEIKQQRNWNWSAIYTALALPVLAFAPATLFLVRRSMFYEVPLACGYACLMGLVLSLVYALSRKSHRRVLGNCEYHFRVSGRVPSQLPVLRARP